MTESDRAPGKGARVGAVGCWTPAAILLAVALGAVGLAFFIPRHQPPPPAPHRAVEPNLDQRLIFTIRRGEALDGFVGYDEAIDVAQRFRLEVRDHGRRISYARARDPRVNRLDVEIVVHAGDRFNLNGPPSAWTFWPAGRTPKPS
ncbi:MAG: hypothetical protein ACRED9_13160 [Caulobacteraceae bacterium]